jgi:hypothetical protein
MKTILLTLAAALLLSASSYAQNVPSYVPTNGLVGWWPFNGNANDESGNGNNGTVNGASLTTDRYGIPNSTYSFDGINDYIQINDASSLDLTNQYTFNAWISLVDYSVNPSSPNSSGSVDNFRTILGKPKGAGWLTGYNLTTFPNGQSTKIYSAIQNQSCCPSTWVISQTIPQLGNWHHIAAVYDGIALKLYFDGVLDSSIQSTFSLDNSTQPLFIGKEFVSVSNNWYRWFKGNIDDIGIWNRALTQQEITALYQGCTSYITNQPSSQTINITTNAQFTTVSSGSSSSFQWQSDLGFGFQNLSNAGQYSGANTNTLTISSVTLANNNQSFRCIVTSGGCSDTSNTAVLTVNNNTGLNELSTSAAFTIYPNPAADFISIKADASLMGKSYILYDAVGRVVGAGIVATSTMSISLDGLSSGLYTLAIDEQYRRSFTVAK